jgi:hypothetical protein
MTASQNVDYSIMARITAKPMPPRPIAIEVSSRMSSSVAGIAIVEACGSIRSPQVRRAQPLAQT